MISFQGNISPIPSSDKNSGKVL